MEIISLTVKTRRGVAVNQVQLIDIDDIATPLIVSGADCQFDLREAKKGPFHQGATNTAITTYVVDQTLAQIAVLAGAIFTANILTVKGRVKVGSPLMGFNAKFICGTIIPYQGGSKYFYQEDADPDLVEYTCSQTPAQILAQITNNSVIAAPILVGKTVFVDATTGNDATAARERFDLMYRSITAAYAAAVSGDTIIVYPGSYTLTANAGKSGVNLEVLSGATINCAAFKFSDGGGNGMSFRISGAGRITGSSTFLSVTGLTSDITVEGVEVSVAAEALPAISLTMDGATLRLKNTKIQNSFDDPASHCIEKIGGNLILNNAILLCTGALAESIHAVAAQDIKIYSCLANRDVTPVFITNLISGTVLYFDTDVE